MAARGSDEDARRIRLEGAVEVLEVAQVRMKALSGALHSLFWRERLFHNADIATAVVRAWDEVELALEKVRALAKKEGWPSRDPLSKLVRELDSARTELGESVLRRLPKSASLSTPDALLALVEDATPAPRGKIERWRSARIALPAKLAELDDVRAFTAFLSSLFARPEQSAAFPWTVSEAEALELQLPVGEAKVSELWRRISALPDGERVERALLQQARFAPVSAPKDGPDTLVAAEFWRRTAWQRVRAVLEENLAPVEVQEHEALAAFVFLARAAEQEDAALGSTRLISAPRAAMITLAHSLWKGSGVNEAEWSRRLALGKVIDAARLDADGSRVIETLAMYARVKRRRGPAGPASRSPPSSVVEALLAAREWALSSGKG